MEDSGQVNNRERPTQNEIQDDEKEVQHQNDEEQAQLDGANVQSVERSAICDEYWRNAVERLYRTVISVSTTKPERMISQLLDEVEGNEQLTEEVVLNKLGCASSDTEKETNTSGVENQASTVGTSSAPEPNERPDEHDQSEQRELYEQLMQVGEILSDGGASGLKNLNGVLFKEGDTKYHSLIEYIIGKLQEQWEHVLNFLLPRQQLQTLILVSLVHVVTMERVLGFVPYLVCYASFLLMIYSTLGMFGSRKWLRQAENWRRLLTIFGHQTRSGDVDEMTVGGVGQSLYIWKTTEPYVSYFISLTVFAFSLALTGGGDGKDVTLPNGWSMCAVSAFLALLCFMALADQQDCWSMWAMALDSVSTLPAIMDKFGVRFNDVPIVKYLFWNREIFRMGLIRVHLGLPSVALLSVVIVYILMLTGCRRRDLFTILVPHLVCVAWWHTSLGLFLISDIGAFVSSSGWYELALTIGVVWLITFPNATSAVLILAVLAVQFKNLLDAIGLVKSAITATILLLPVLYWKVRQLAERRYLTMAEGRLKKTMLALMVYGFVVFTAMALLSDGTGMVRTRRKELTWTQYERQCSYGDENLGNRLQQQMTCSQFGGISVKWKGTIQGVRIVKIENIFETVLSYLPEPLAWRLRCLYGQGRNETWSTGSTVQGLEIGECSLVNRNVYTFELDAAGPWGQHTFSSAKGTVVLVASSTFQELAIQLEQGDVVEFTASFVSDTLLKYPPKLKLLQLQCLACQHVANEKHSKRYVANSAVVLWTKLFNACCFLFNFVFSPLFIIGQ